MPMPFPYHAVPLRMSFPFDLHSADMSDSHLPCHAHAAPMLCSDRAVLLKDTAQHGRRQTACGLPAAFHFFRLPRGVPRRLLSEAYQSSSQRSVPTTVKSGSSTLQKKDSLLNCRTSSLDISGYRTDFHEGHGTVGAGQGCGMACVN